MLSLLRDSHFVNSRITDQEFVRICGGMCACPITENCDVGYNFSG